MKCKKCSGDIPYGSFGNTKCEYCGTVNYVPLPQEYAPTVSKPEVVEEKGKKPSGMSSRVIVSILAVLGGLAVIGIIMSGLDDNGFDGGGFEVGDVVVASDVTGFGDYIVPVNSEFKVGDPIYFYAEALNSLHGSKKELDFSFEVYDPTNYFLVYEVVEVKETDDTTSDHAAWYWTSVGSDWVPGEYTMKVEIYDWIDVTERYAEAIFYVMPDYGEKYDAVDLIPMRITGYSLEELDESTSAQLEEGEKEEGIQAQSGVFAGYEAEGSSALGVVIILEGDTEKDAEKFIESAISKSAISGSEFSLLGEWSTVSLENGIFARGVFFESAGDRGYMLIWQMEEFAFVVMGANPNDDPVLVAKYIANELLHQLPFALKN